MEGKLWGRRMNERIYRETDEWEEWWEMLHRKVMNKKRDSVWTYRQIQRDRMREIERRKSRDATIQGCAQVD